MSLKRFLLLNLLFIVTLFLQGCVNTAVSGAQAVYNHKSVEKDFNDQFITMQAYRDLDINTDQFKNGNINVSTFNRVVLLSGQVPEAWQKAEAEKIVRKINGINQVYNLLTISKPSSQFARMRDTWITTKIKSKLIASDDVDATQIKVVTEKGAVYLMGIIPPKDANAAVYLARTTDGVREVIKIFSYIKISKSPDE